MNQDFKYFLSQNISVFLKHPLFKVEARVHKFCKQFPTETWEMSDFARVLRSFNLTPVPFLFEEIDTVAENTSLLLLREPTGIILPDEFYTIPLNWVKFKKNSMGVEIEYLPGKFKIFHRDVLGAFAGKEYFGFSLDFC